MYVYIVRWSYADHCCAFSTLELAQEEATADQSNELPTHWEHFDTDMQNIEMWQSTHSLHNGNMGVVTITKYPLDSKSLVLAGLS